MASRPSLSESLQLSFLESSVTEREKKAAAAVKKEREKGDKKEKEKEEMNDDHRKTTGTDSQPAEISVWYQIALCAIFFGSQISIEFVSIFSVLSLQYFGLPVYLVTINGMASGLFSMLVIPIIGAFSDRGSNPKMRKALIQLVTLGVILSAYVLLVVANLLKTEEESSRMKDDNIIIDNTFIGNRSLYYYYHRNSKTDAFPEPNYYHRGNHTDEKADYHVYRENFTIDYVSPEISITHNDNKTESTTITSLSTSTVVADNNFEKDNNNNITIPAPAIIGIVIFLFTDIGYDLSMSLPRGMIAECIPDNQRARVISTGTSLSSLGGITMGILGALDLPAYLGSVFGGMDGMAATLILLASLIALVCAVTFTSTVVTVFVLTSRNRRRSRRGVVVDSESTRLLPLKDEDKDNEDDYDDGDDYVILTTPRREAKGIRRTETKRTRNGNGVIGYGSFGSESVGNSTNKKSSPEISYEGNSIKTLTPHNEGSREKNLQPYHYGTERSSQDSTRNDAPGIETTTTIPIKSQIIIKEGELLADCYRQLYSNVPLSCSGEPEEHYYNYRGEKNNNDDDNNNNDNNDEDKDIALEHEIRNVKNRDDSRDDDDSIIITRNDEDRVVKPGDDHHYNSNTADNELDPAAAQIEKQGGDCQTPPPENPERNFTDTAVPAKKSSSRRNHDETKTKTKTKTAGDSGQGPFFEKMAADCQSQSQTKTTVTTTRHLECDRYFKGYPVNRRFIVTLLSAFNAFGIALCGGSFISNALTIEVLHGEPLALPGTPERNRYEEGLRLSSLGFLLYGATYLVTSIVNRKLMEKIDHAALLSGCSFVMGVTCCLFYVMKSLSFYFVMMAAFGAHKCMTHIIPFVLALKHSEPRNKATSGSTATPKGSNAGRVTSLIGALIPFHNLIISLIMGPAMDAAGTAWIPIWYITALAFSNCLITGLLLVL